MTSIYAAVWLSLITPAYAQNLNIGVGSAPISADPHFSVLTPNVSLASHSYDALINRDASSKPIPGLALSWRLLDDTTWEFKLRPGVKFHNGDGFTAEDVAHTLARVPQVVNSPGSFALYVRPFIGVIIVDPLTIRLKTAAVYPLAARTSGVMPRNAAATTACCWLVSVLVVFVACGAGG